MTRRSILLPLAAVAAACAAALPIAAGNAQSGPRTITLTYAKPAKTFIDDVAPRTTGRGKVSIGDRMVGIQSIRAGGKTVGTMHTDATVTNRTPSPFSRFTALIDATFHLGDGDLDAVGFVDSAAGGDRYTIVGGTGAYAGARGSAKGSEGGIVIALIS
ncbi:MAG: hypothetical protein WKF42_00975 [Solirubrobacteraceae bacterium]